MDGDEDGKNAVLSVAVGEPTGPQGACRGWKLERGREEAGHGI